MHSDRTSIKLRSTQIASGWTLRSGKYLLKLTFRGSIFGTGIWYSLDNQITWQQMTADKAGTKYLVIESRRRGYPIFIQDSDIDGDTDFDFFIEEVASGANPFFEIRNCSGSYTPVLTGTTSNPNFTYTTLTGNYNLIGNICIADVVIIIASIVSNGSGYLKISLPFAPVNTGGGSIHYNGIDISANTVDLVPSCNTADSTFYLVPSKDNSGSIPFSLGSGIISVGDTIIAQVIYRIAD